jgi:acetyltransferase-like isoleucine patch superfamily enzyme
VRFIKKIFKFFLLSSYRRFIIRKLYFNYFFLNKKHSIKKGFKPVQKVVLSGKGSIKIGENVSFGVTNGGNFYGSISQIDARSINSKVIIEKDVNVNNNLFICCYNSVIIREKALIGANVTIFDFEAHGTSVSQRDEIGSIGTVIIEKNVWIGNNVIILKNVTIGAGSIIAAGSVVLKGKYPPNSLIGGNPAKFVRIIE